MVDKNLTSMLDDPNPEQRKIAIKKLAQTKDPEALPYLATVFKTDRDPDVREIARKAGVYIKQSIGGSSTSSTSTPSSGYGSSPSSSSIYGGYDAEEEEDGGGYAGYGFGSGSLFVEDEEDEPKAKSYPYVSVTEKQKTQAEKLVDQAMGATTRNDQVRATKFISQAFEKNPNLRNDPYTVSLASQITGIDKYRVVDELASGAVLINEKKKSKRDTGGAYYDKDPRDTTWGEAFVDLLIYGIVNMLIIGIGFIALFFLLQTTFEALANDPAFQQELAAEGLTMTDVNRFMTQVANEGISLVLLYAGIVAVFSIIALLIQLFAVHLAATTFMGGDGTFAGLIHQVTLFLAFTYALQILLSIGSLVLAVSNPSYDPQIGQALSFFVGIVILFQTGNLIGKAYQFGMGNGCVSLFLGTVLLVLIGCACGYLLSAAAVNAAMGF